jgi:hypothetical protein
VCELSFGGNNQRECVRVGARSELPARDLERRLLTLFRHPSQVRGLLAGRGFARDRRRRQGGARVEPQV